MLDPLLHASDIVANKTVNNIFFYQIFPTLPASIPSCT